MIGKLSNKHPAFTLVEFATVIGLLSVLTTVMILGYGTWQQGLAARQVQDELQSALTAANNYKFTNNNYPLSLPTSYKAGNNVTVSVAASSTVSAICLNGVSSKFSTIKYYVSTSVSTPTAGVCP